MLITTLNLAVCFAAIVTTSIALPAADTTAPDPLYPSINTTTNDTTSNPAPMDDSTCFPGHMYCGYDFDRYKEYVTYMLVRLCKERDLCDDSDTYSLLERSMWKCLDPSDNPFPWLNLKLEAVCDRACVSYPGWTVACIGY
ncbi:hypothetical protein BU16DRAFT_557715 [Lophium mytilinum]|uniref:Uncharacterized protein n=1 Tax=Lophium mytilinum TaxID=390894 RepID=A0A6A6R4J7_9PEZI|nr:hypothetical protein BU16DRAFT_557715 [Lophium mytilinum]